MAEEPQKAPVPLRLQADYLRLREEEKSLRLRAANSDEWKARHDEMLAFIRSHKDGLNG
jgi:hypothetical protein